MLASAPVRTLAERQAAAGAVVAGGAGILCFAALFFGRGLSLGPLVWIGGFAVLLAAAAAAAALAGFVPAPRLDGPAAVFLGALFALAVWVGLTTLWSASPEASWQYTNRTLVYAMFALLGVLAATQLARPAETVADGAAVLLALLLAWALLAKCVPALYSDYGRLARLRAPLDYWNELALLAVVAVPVVELVEVGHPASKAGPRPPVIGAFGRWGQLGADPSHTARSGTGARSIEPRRSLPPTGPGAAPRIRPPPPEGRDDVPAHGARRPRLRGPVRLLYSRAPRRAAGSHGGFAERVAW